MASRQILQAFICCGLLIGCHFQETETAITLKLDKMCSILPPTMKEKCDIFVSQYGPTMIGLLEQPEELCSKIGLCQDTPVASSMMMPAWPQLGAAVPSMKRCTICEFIMTKVDQRLLNSSSGAEALPSFHTVCPTLPAMVQSKCTKFIDIYGLLINKHDPQQACTYLGLCEKPATIAAAADVSTEADTPAHQCALCEIINYKIHMLIGKKNFTQTEVLMIMDKVCNFLPPTIKDTCDTFINNFGSMMTTSITQSKEVCTKIGLCMDASVAKLATPLMTPAWPQFGSAVPSVKKCTLCEFIMTKVEQRLLNGSKAGIVPSLNTICPTLPPFIQAKCTQFADTYGSLINEHDPKQACSYLGLCEKPATVAAAADLSTEADTPAHQCALCEIINYKIHMLIGKKNFTQTEVLMIMDKVCNFLPPTIKDTCDAFIGNFGSMMTTSITQSKEVCTKIGLCIDASVAKLATPLMTPAWPQFGSAVPSVKKCTLCEFIMTKVEQRLLNGSKADIVPSLNTICPTLPPFIQAKCTQFADTYGILINEHDPKQACSYLGLCEKPATIAATADVSTEADTLAHQCVVCEMVNYKIHMLIGKKNFTQAEVMLIMDKVCKFLPPAIKDTCDTFINNFGSMMTTSITQSKEVCTKIGLCQDTALATAKVASPMMKPAWPQFGTAVPSVKKCTLCEFIMTKIDQRMMNSSSKTGIMPSLNTICPTLPPFIQTKCIQFADTYGSLINEHDPKQACSYLGLCEKAATIAAAADVSTEADTSVHQCALCEMVNYKIHVLIGKKNFTQMEVMLIMDKVCKFLPSTIKGTCDTFISNFGSMITTSIEKSKEVCTDIGLCAMTAKEEMTPFWPILNPVGVKVKECAVCETIVIKLKNSLTGKMGSTGTDGNMGKVMEALLQAAPSTTEGKRLNFDFHGVAVIVAGVLVAIACTAALVYLTLRARRPTYVYGSLRGYEPVESAKGHDSLKVAERTSCNRESHPLLHA